MKVMKKICSFMMGIMVVLSLNISKAEAYPSSLSLNIDSVQQEEDNWCWAACIKCTADYLNGNWLSQSEIVESVKGYYVDEGADYTEIKQGLNDDGISTTFTNDYLSFSSVKSMISGWYSPIVASVNFYDSDDGHVVVIYGYSRSTGNRVKFMDPSDGSWNSMSHSTFVDNSVFTWTKTFYKNYVA